jgi:hypothetical protein
VGTAQRRVLFHSKDLYFSQSKRTNEQVLDVEIQLEERNPSRCPQPREKFYSTAETRGIFESPFGTISVKTGTDWRGEEVKEAYIVFPSAPKRAPHSSAKVAATTPQKLSMNGYRTFAALS